MNKEELLARIKELEADRQQAVEQTQHWSTKINTVQGQMLECTYWLAKLDPSTAKDKTDKKPVILDTKE